MITKVVDMIVMMNIFEISLIKTKWIITKIMQKIIMTTMIDDIVLMHFVPTFMMITIESILIKFIIYKLNEKYKDKLSYTSIIV